MAKPVNCFFVDLALIPLIDDGAPKPFDGMAAGNFTDMWGSDVIIAVDDLPFYVANTKAALASTKDAAGNVVGFPVDGIDHRGGFAAGWIVDVNLALGREVIEFTPRWNADGLANIASDLVRYFSATFDMKAKTILGGSLTNWPATRDEAHNILLHPIELGSRLLVADMPARANFNLMDSIKSIVEGVVNGLRGAVVEPDKTNPTEKGNDMAELTEPVILPVVDLASPEISAEINRRVDEQVAAKLALAKRQDDIKAFATQLSSAGMPVDVTEFLTALPDPYPAMETIKAVATAQRIDFSEHGHGKIITGAQPLPENLKPVLTNFLASGLTIEAFFRENAVELGAQEDYNLAEFQPKENK